MDHDTIILVDHVSKKYCKSLKRGMLYGIADISRNLLGLSTSPHVLRQNEFWAVDDVHFRVRRGETLGLVGPNGCGKTTILKMINGIFWPDRGRIRVAGRVGALIAVGAGFHPLLTGRENIYVNGAILGMSRAEMREKLDAIVEFAELDDFLDTPVKHYSSGMFVRLGFAVAIHCEPDILLVDEVLAVGDARFQAKCISKMKELERKGTTIIYVSHNLNSVYLMCENSLYLSNGRPVHYGPTRDVLNEYRKDILRNSPEDATQSPTRHGTQEIQIKEVVFVDESDVPRDSFRRGDVFQIKIVYEAHARTENAEFAITIYATDGTKITQPTTRDHKVPLGAVEGRGEIRYKLRSMPLNIGRYIVSVGAFHSSGFVAYDTHDKLYEFLVEDGDIDGRIHERAGLIYLPAEWEVHP